jgi:hypothetical protein
MSNPTNLPPIKMQEAKKKEELEQAEEQATDHPKKLTQLYTER